MKDRLITREEINEITKKSPPRERAFFTIMRQSGLAPHIIRQLKIDNVERILESNTPIPCRIALTKEKTPTFIGHEAVSHLKEYLREREDPKQESPLFTIRNKPNKEINTKDVSRTFRRAAQSLETGNKINRENQERARAKNGELRLYSLKRFYEENAKHYIFQLKNKTTPRNDDYYRKLYEKEAMPKLEIEPLTPLQMHQLEDRLAKIEKTVQETYLPVRRLYYEIVGLIPEDENILFEELRPNSREKNEEDREQRIQKTLHRLAESWKEKDKKARAKRTANSHDVPRNSDDT